MTLWEEFSAGKRYGFNWLRLWLAIGIFTFHSVTISEGSADALPRIAAAAANLILPMFFALSGFLVTASLARHQSLLTFLLHRLARLLPALVVVVAATTFVLGPLTTHEPLTRYFESRRTFSYLGNILGMAQFDLPGVFASNPRPGVVNGSLWTVAAEAWCYLSVIPLFIFGLLKKTPALIATVLITLAFLLTAFVSEQSWTKLLPTGELVLPFFAGVVIYALARRLPSSMPAALACLLAGLAVSYFNGNTVIASVPIAYATVWLGLRELGRPSRDCSYGLYLVGYPVLQTFVHYWPHQSWYIGWSVCLPISLGLAAVLWDKIEHPTLKSQRAIPARLAPLAALLVMVLPLIRSSGAHKRSFDQGLP